MQTEFNTYGGPGGGYADPGYGGDAAALGALLVFGAFALLIGLALYAVQAIFQTKILRNAGYSNPVAGAWVPVWNLASLLQVGGIKQAWRWTLIVIGLNILGSAIPGVGIIFSLAVVVLMVILYIWLAKGLQAALRTGGTGGIVLAVLVPFAWIIWMGIVSGRERYDRTAALREGGAMPMDWLGSDDRNAPFPGEPAEGHWDTRANDGEGPVYGAPAASQGSWNGQPAGPQAPQPAPGYGAPQSPQAQPPVYGGPQQAAPSAPAAYPYPSVPPRQDPEQGGFSLPPVVRPEESRDAQDVPPIPTPPAPPRYSAPLPPQEAAKDGPDGNRTV